MKAFLLYKDQDFEVQQELSANDQTLAQDLELDTLCNGMALGDKFIFSVVKRAVLSGVSNDLDTILYRQAILRDCLKNPVIIADIYKLAIEAIENERKNYWGILSNYPSAILHRSVEVLQMFVSMLKKLRKIADDNSDRFDSEGFRALFNMLKEELGEEYFASVQQHLRRLKFRDGVMISAELGNGNKGVNYVLRKGPDKKPNWLELILAERPPVYTFYIHPRDESGGRALSGLNDTGINLVANALAQSTDHILSFFTMLRIELGFYIGCLNLCEQLEERC